MASEDRERSREGRKLNMDHGFMQSVIKNQVDRDVYDQEQKALKLQKKISTQSRPKRAPIQMYVPPHLRAKANNKQEPSSKDWEGEQPKKPMAPASTEIRMKLEFVRQDGEIRELNICEGEDLRNVVSSFGKANGLDARLRDALLQRISSALKGRAS